MGFNRPTRHHFIPQMLLNNFCNENDQLWVCNKPQGKIYPTTPEDAFVKHHLCTNFTPVYDPSGGESEECRVEINESFEYEKMLSDIEGKAVPAVKRIIEQARRGRCPHLSTELRARFAARDSPRERDQTERFSRETGLGVMEIRIPERGFAIGSQGITIVQSSYKNDPASGSWLPIAHDVVVAPTTFPDEEFLLTLNDDNGDSIIKRINEATFSQSKVIAGQSETLIRSLMRSWSSR